MSRNRTVGKRLGQGEKLETILASMKEVAEGVATSKFVFKLKKLLTMEGLPLSYLKNTI